MMIQAQPVHFAGDNPVKKAGEKTANKARDVKDRAKAAYLNTNPAVVKSAKVSAAATTGLSLAANAGLDGTVSSLVWGGLVGGAVFLWHKLRK